MCERTCACYMLHVCLCVHVWLGTQECVYIYIYLFPNVEAKDRYACVISLNVQACVGV